jgi:hypothetical protein
MGLLDFFGSLFGGGGGDDAYERARADEEARRKEIQAAQRRIEGIFASPERQQQYLDFEDATRRYLFSDLDRERDRNARELKFALARSGLSRGSTDIDQNRLLSETYLRGIAEAERRTQQAGANLESADQQAKQQLFSQILAGADATTASQNAAQMMRTNAALAQQDSIVNAFDSLFGDFGDIYKNSREAAGERRASYDFGSLFGPRPQTQAVTVAGGNYPGQGR